MRNKKTLKGDIRIVHDSGAQLPGSLPLFLEGMSRRAGIIYRILRELMVTQRISDLLSDFSNLAGVSNAIIDMDGNVLPLPNGSISVLIFTGQIKRVANGVLKATRSWPTSWR